ncbi:lysine 2,3-aminomutase [Vibrio sp. qd031]|uniref:EF-P beta-lysylation protein EpmB n=1 Tax=Vibrio sp. qd031 TaxID=1603038 RepID=UPI000A11FB7C|nr:EF-P beta-lysylation protein EpmB [Vibrio sp. qd031]ORT51921.1 lysine 2,3-aminomutase [Vibrio sp. qd031]
MPHIITRNIETVEQNWLFELANGISDPQKLLNLLEIDSSALKKGFEARTLFAQRVPLSFVARMEKGNPNDPLLLQVLPSEQEFEEVPGFLTDPLEEQHNSQPGLLHKYKNRALMVLKGGCAINCRYCFRRHFPYQDNPGNKHVWQTNIDYIAQHPQINEVILSGGDPLMAKDSELYWLITQLEKVPHIKRLRIHTRLPVVIPSRITDALCDMLELSRFKVILVTHINHPNEINHDVSHAMAKLKKANVHLLNQAVLLKGINNCVDTLVNLCESLFDAGIQPYYLFALDKVKGAAHYYVCDDDARQLMQGLVKEVSGYMVPKLAREIGGRPSKTPLDLHLE